MNNFQIKIKTNEELNNVLSKMEKDGVLWFGGAKPTTANLNSLQFPYVLYVNDDFLTWGFKFKSKHFDTSLKIITVEEYLKGENKMFNKKDLKTGHIVVLNNGMMFIVMKNMSYYDNDTQNETSGDVLIHKNGYMPLNEYNDNLRHKSNDFSIKEVLISKSLNKTYDIENTSTVVIWERPEPKEMTVAEIENILGYPVKIVK